MKIPNMKYAPIFSENVYQELLKDTLKNSQSIINSLYSMIHFVLANNYSNSQYDYDVLFLVGIKGAQIAIDTYDYKEKFIDHARTIIKLKIKSQLDNKKYPTLTRDYDKFVLSIIEKLQIDKQYEKKCMSYIKYYVETAKASYREIILRYYGFYGKNYSFSELSELVNLSQHIVEVVISKFETNVKVRFKKKEVSLSTKLNVSEEKQKDKVKQEEQSNRKPVKYKSFYDRVKKYVTSEGEMWEIFNSLCEDYKNTLIQMYGPNLDEYHEVTDEIRKKIYNIINNKFKKRQKTINYISLYDRVKKYVTSEEEMWKIFNSLSEDHKSALIQMYGPTLDEYHEVTDEIRKKINHIIYNKFKKKVNNIPRTLYDRVKKYVTSEEEMWEIFNSLSEDYKSALIQLFGPNLDEYHEVTDETRKKIYSIIQNKFKFKQQNKRKLCFYDKIKEYVPSKEEMWEIFNSLSEDYKNALIQMYGPNLDEYHKVSKEMYQKVQNIINNKFKKKRKTIKCDLLYYRLKPYITSKEEMWEIFNSLSEDYKNTLIQMYGPNLDEYHEVSSEIKRKIYFIIKKFKNKSNNKPTTLYDRVKSYVSSKEEMWEIFNSLSEDYKNTLIQMYGATLDEYHDVTIEIKRKISNIINSKFKNKTKTIKKLYFYERVKKYVSSKEEMWEIFNSLSEDKKNTLIQIYGPNLDEYHEVSSEIRTKVSDIIKCKFKLKYKNRIVSLYERVKKYVSSEEKMWEIFNSLSEDYKNTLIQMYGPNLDEYHEVTDELRKKVNLIIYNKFKRKHKNKNKYKYKTLYDRVKKYVSSEEEMWEIFNSLNKYYQNVLIQMYGPNLDDYNDKVSEEIIKKVPGIIDNKFKNKTKNRKNCNFYERVKPYITNKEEMFEIFNSLSENYKKILIQAYGPNLDEFFEVSSEIKQKINYIIQKEFKNKIKNHFKLFYDRVKKYVSSEEEMWEIFNSLSEEYKKILIQMYGPNLDEYHDVSSEIKTKVSYIIINRFKMKHKNRKVSLYDRVKSYVSSEEDMWNIFNSLSEYYKSALIQMYGPNLDEYHEVSSEVKNTVSNIIKNKFKKKQKTIKCILLYERVKSYVSSEEEMWEIFNSLSEDHKNILIQMYGPNLDEYFEVSSEIKTKVSYIIKFKFKNKIKNKKSISLYDRVKSYVSSKEEMWEIFNSLSEDYKNILIQMYGPNLDEYHEVTPEIKRKISNIINSKFKNRVKTIKKLYFYDRVKSYVPSKEKMWEIFNSLSEDYKNILIQAYGPNLDEYHEVSIEVKKTISNIINNKFRMKHKNRKKSLYDRVKSFVSDEQEMWEIFNALSKDLKDALIQMYGPNLDEYHKVTPEIGRKISIIINNKFKNRVKTRKKLYFYDRVKSYVSSKEEMWEIFNSLSEDYKNILIQAYGPNLDEYHEVSSKVKKTISNIINNKFRMKHKNRKISLYDRVKSFVSDEQEMWEIFNALSKDLKDALIQMYGPNLDDYNDEVSNDVKKKVKNIIYTKFNRRVPNVKGLSLYERLKDCVFSEKEMKQIFNSLSAKNQNILIQVFGENLDEYNKNVSSEVARKATEIIRNIKKSRKDSNIVSLYMMLKDYSKNDVNAAISLLDAKEKEKLYMRYGYDLSNPVKVPISEEIIEEVENVIIPKLRLILERNKRKPIFRIDENMVLELSKLFGLLKIKDSANKKDILITLIYLYCMESGLSITKLEEMLEIEKDEIDVIVKGVISNYNNAIYEMYLKFMGLLNQTDKKDNLHIGFINNGDKNE